VIVLTVVATKGGVGKTTTTANLGGLLRDLGFRVLLIDADVQPSLSKYFKYESVAESGLTKVVTSGFLSPDCISRIALPFEEFRIAENLPRQPVLSIVRSDTREGNLQDWLSPRLDRLVRLSMALRTESIEQQFDFVIIDTQGALGHLQDAAINAADILISPATPDVLSAREFIEGTLNLINRTEQAVNLGHKVPAMRAIINRTENTRDSRHMADLIRDGFIALRGRVTVMGPAIPAIVAFKKAATMQVPVHWVDPARAGDAMHQILWELIPSLEGKLAANHRDYVPPSQLSDSTPTALPAATSAPCPTSESE